MDGWMDVEYASHDIWMKESDDDAWVEREASESRER
jgi:hypothetical protein